MLLWRIIYSQGSVDELRCRSATNEFNIWRMLSKPVRYPSSWLPSRHGLRWSISIPSGTRCVLAKSIIHIPAFVLSCMNNKDVPMSCQNQLRLVEAVRWIEKKSPIYSERLFLMLLLCFFSFHTVNSPRDWRKIRRRWASFPAVQVVRHIWAVQWQSKPEIMCKKIFLKKRLNYTLTMHYQGMRTIFDKLFENSQDLGSSSKRLVILTGCAVVFSGALDAESEPGCRRDGLPPHHVPGLGHPTHLDLFGGGSAGIHLAHFIEHVLQGWKIHFYVHCASSQRYS